MHRTTIGEITDHVDTFDPFDENFQKYAMRDLGRELNRESVVAFVGSGISMQYGLPDWKTLTRILVEKALGDLHKDLEDKSSCAYISFNDKMYNLDLSDPKDKRLAFLIEFLNENFHSIASNLFPNIQELCEFVLKERNYDDTFRNNLKDIIGSAAIFSINERSLPIYVINKHLKIRKYLTTNYDDLLGEFFGLVHKVDDRIPTQLAYSERREPRCLDMNRLSELAEFALATGSKSRSVFHLHGRVPFKPGSNSSEETKSDENYSDQPLVLTEKDYKNLYLRDDVKSRFFRESLDLLYASNTMLFLGLGMSEDDLNRILRKNFSNTPYHLNRRAFLIQVVPTEGIDDEATLEYEKLKYSNNMVTRYGVRTIFYGDFKFVQVINSIKGNNEGFREKRQICKDRNQKINKAYREQFQKCLEEIEKHWNSWWDCWNWTPENRRVKFASRNEILEFTQVKQATWGEQYLKGPTQNFKITSRHYLTKGGNRWTIATATKQWKELGTKIRASRIRLKDDFRPFVWIEGKRGAGRGDLIDALIRVENTLKIVSDSILENGNSDNTNYSAFLGSTHFSNEFVSTADAVATHLAQVFGHVNHLSGGSWYMILPALVSQIRKQTKSKMQHKKALVALSGIQRLTDSDGNLPNPDLVKFFSLLSKLSSATGNRLAIVLIGRTGSLNSQTMNLIGFTNSDVGEKPHFPTMNTYHTNYLNNISNKSNLSHRTQTAILALKISGDGRSPSPKLISLLNIVDCHKYCSVLLDETFRKFREIEHKQGDVEELIDKLIRKIRQRGGSHLAEMFVKCFLRLILPCFTNSAAEKSTCLAKHHESKSGVYNEVSLVILKVLSICPAPIDRSTLIFLVANEPGFAHEDKIVECLDLLTSLFLVYKFFPRSRHRKMGSDTENSYYRYAVHSIVRSVLQHEIGHKTVPFADPGYFELSSPESTGVGVPAADGSAVLSIYHHIFALLENVPKDKKPSEKEYVECQLRLRCAQQLIRYNISFSHVLQEYEHVEQKYYLGDSVGRLGQHREVLVRLLNGVRIMSGLNVSEFPDVSKDAEKSHLLYSEELIWIYNEIGIICRWQGELIEANSVLTKAEIIRRNTQGERESEAWAHLKIQTAVIELEMGRISHAMHLLNEVRQSNIDSKSILQFRALAYLALGDHLRGEHKTARKSYHEVLEYCRINERHRSFSLFNRHLGDLYRFIGKFGKAEACYEEALVKSVAYPDLYNHTRIAQAELSLHTSPREIPKSIKYLDDALKYARSTGLPRMEADVAAARAEIGIAQGEFDAAASHAREAIAISGFRGMRLREVSNFARLGKVQALRNEKEDAKRILTAARANAQGMHYLTLAKGIHEFLANM